MSCPFKVNNNTIEITVHTTCYCILDLLCVTEKDNKKKQERERETERKREIGRKRERRKIASKTSLVFGFCSRQTNIKSHFKVRSKMSNKKIGETYSKSCELVHSIETKAPKTFV